MTTSFENGRTKAELEIRGRVENAPDKIAYTTERDGKRVIVTKDGKLLCDAGSNAREAASKLGYTLKGEL